MHLVARRLPGVLGAVAAEIGAAQGNVVGLEVLERESGVAIDELVVELPDAVGAVEAVCRGVGNVPGAGVEDATELLTNVVHREDTVLAAAAGILQAATPTAAVNALTGHLIAVYDLSWLAVADAALESFAEVHGDVPPVHWGARSPRGPGSGADPANDTTGSGVFVEPVPETGSTVCGGRGAPISVSASAEEIALLVMVAARFIDAFSAVATVSSPTGDRDDAVAEPRSRRRRLPLPRVL